MCENYTEKARKVLFLARCEASQMGSKVIGSEHLLLGLIKEGDDLVRDLFSRSGVNLELLRAELEARGLGGAPVVRSAHRPRERAAEDDPGAVAAAQEQHRAPGRAGRRQDRPGRGPG